MSGRFMGEKSQATVPCKLQGKKDVKLKHFSLREASELHQATTDDQCHERREAILDDGISQLSHKMQGKTCHAILSPEWWIQLSFSSYLLFPF